MKWGEDLVLCHDNRSRVVLSRMAPALSLGLHVALVLVCLCAARPNLKAQTLVRPVAYEVALVTLEHAGGSGHPQGTALAVTRVESPLPRREAVAVVPKPFMVKPRIAPDPERPSAVKAVPDSPVPEVRREIAAAVDQTQEKAAPQDTSRQMATGEVAATTPSPGGWDADSGQGEAHPLGLPAGIGGGLGRGELQGGIGQVDVLPRILRKIEPRYPVGARERGVTGSVSVRFLVDGQGRVLEPQVVAADPPGVFEQSALSAVRRWRFKAAKKDGQQVATWVILPIRFSLE